MMKMNMNTRATRFPLDMKIVSIRADQKTKMNVKRPMIVKKIY